MQTQREIEEKLEQSDAAIEKLDGVCQKMNGSKKLKTKDRMKLRKLFSGLRQDADDSSVVLTAVKAKNGILVEQVT